MISFVPSLCSLPHCIIKNLLHTWQFVEVLKSVICDVIKIRVRRRDATINRKGNQPLNIKTGVERPILKLGLSNFRWIFYFILLLVASLLYRHFYDVTHDTFRRFQFVRLQPIKFPGMIEGICIF